jgi:effector-binding domain-containing protein
MLHITVEDVPSQTVAVVRRLVRLNELPGFFGEAFVSVEAAVERAGGVVAGPPFGWYHDTPTDEVDVSAGFVVTGLAEGPLDGNVEVAKRPGGLAAVVLHIGPYDAMEETYRELGVWLNTRQLDAGAECWEEYLSDPEADPDPATWETRVVRPLV